MATIARQPIGPYQGLGINATPMYREQEAATVSGPAGSLLIFSSGYLAEAGANPAMVTIEGISVEDGHSDTAAATHTLGYIPIQIPMLWVGNLGDNATEASVTTALARATHIGTIYGLTAGTGSGSSRYWFVDTNKVTTNARIRIVGFVDNEGDVNGRVIFRFLNIDGS